MSDHQHIFQPATILRVNAIGVPGERTFFLQGGDTSQLVTLLIEKAQVQILAVGVIQMINGIESEQTALYKSRGDYVEAEMQLVLPLDPMFRVDEVSMGYDLEKDLLLLKVAEEGAKGHQQQVMFLVTREKMHGFARWALELANRGKPDPLQPKKAGGNGFHHSNNGHKS